MSARWDEDLQQYWRTVRWAIEMYRCSLRPREYFGIPTEEYNPYAPRAKGASAGGQTEAGAAEATSEPSSSSDGDRTVDSGVDHPTPKTSKRADSVTDSSTSTSTTGPPIAIHISKGHAISFAKPGSKPQSKSDREQKKKSESLEELEARAERTEAEAKYYDEQLSTSQLELGELQERRVKEDLSGNATRTSLQEQVQRLKAVKAGSAAEVQSRGAGNALSRQSQRVSADGFDLNQMEQALAASRAEQGVKQADTQDRRVASPLLPDPDDDGPPAATVDGGQNARESPKPSEMSEEEQLRRAIEMSLQDLESDEPSSEADPAVTPPDMRISVGEMGHESSGGPEDREQTLNEVVDSGELADRAAEHIKDAKSAPDAMSPTDATTGGDTGASLSSESGGRSLRRSTRRSNLRESMDVDGMDEDQD
ncbi:hypothetical protein EJ03DRAFT_354250 [Teratosphaeria nubilosa]|uniref:Uncharacterized protein n=1 Tax=Teratosphaeria nubilosa TaxID=161662 RepID=A0A6G1L122_9PEZI|nr:hypothetical protein EJ03DRAFT_354250 [Teratosphaeria nubilosa]